MDFAALLKVGVESSSLLTAEKAMDSLADTGERTEAAVTTATSKMNAGFTATEASVRNLGSASALQGNNMRMLGQQLSQVAQQGSVTGNYLGALAVQLPDLALAFGPVAMAASIVATVAMPALISMFGSGATAAERLTDANSALGSSISALRSIAESDLEVIRRKYGEIDAQLVTLLAHQRENTLLAAQSAAKEAVAALAAEYGVASGAMNLFKITGKGAALEVADSLGLTRNQFIAFQQAISDARTATTLEAAADATARIEQYLQMSTQKGSEMAVAVTNAALGLRSASEESERSETAIQQARNAAAGLSAVVGSIDMSNVTGQAGILASRLGVSLDTAIALNAVLNKNAGIETAKKATGSGLTFGLNTVATQKATTETLKFGSAAQIAAQSSRRAAQEAKALAAGLSGGGSKGSGGGVSGAAGKATEALTEAEEAAKKYADTMKGYVTDGIGKAVDWMVGGFKGGLRGLVDVFKSTIQQMIAYAIKNKIMIGLGMGGGGGFAGAASAATGGGGGGAGGLLGGKLLGGFGESGSIFGMGGLGGGTGLMGGLGNAISGGFGNIFNIGANAAAAGGGFLASLGAAIPVLGAVSLAFSFFKKKTELLDSGLKVTIDGMDALVETFTKTKTTRFWGLSKKTSTDTQAASKEISDPITAAFKNIRKTVIGLAGDLGLSKSRLEDFQMALTVSTKGMSQEEAQGAVMKELGKLGDGLAKAMLGGMTRFAKSGEGALDTLARLSGNLTAANDAMKALGWSAFKVKASGIGAASAMVELYGGLDKFKAATDFYFQNFYTLAERTRYTGKQFRDAIGDLGIKTVPKSIEQFRALMDRLREAGRDKAVAGLMQLAPLFMSMQDLKGQLDGVGDSATNAASRLQEREGLERRLLELQGKTAALRKLELRALDPTNRALQRVIWRLEDAQGAASKAKDAFKASADAERARISELQGMSARIRGMATSAIEATFGVSEAQRKSAESQLRLAVQTGQVWGSQLEALAETAMAVDASNFGSSLDFLRASARAAGVLASVSDAQASAAGTAEDRLEAALKKYGLQDATVLSLSEAMRRLDVALSRLATAEAQAIRVAAGKSAIDAPYKPTTSQGGKSAMKAEESQAAMQTELSEIKGFMRELVKISIKQERTLKEIELQGEVV